MARRLAVASRSRFELLLQDEIDYTDSEDEDEYTQAEPTSVKLEAVLP